MQKRSILTALTLAAVTAATLSTAAVADRLGMGGQVGMMNGGPMQLLDFDAMDTDKDGKLTTDEMAAYRAARVAAMDANNDGKLSVEELTAMQMQGMQERATARATNMIEQMDADKDGMLSAAEMMAGPNPSGMLGRLDADGDGALSKAELENVQANMRGGKGGQGERGGHRGGMYGDGHGYDGEGHGHGGGMRGWFDGDDN